MSRNHMLAPTAHRETALCPSPSKDAVLGPPAAASAEATALTEATLLPLRPAPLPAAAPAAAQQRPSTSPSAPPRLHPPPPPLPAPVHPRRWHGHSQICQTHPVPRPLDVSNHRTHQHSSSDGRSHVDAASMQFSPPPDLDSLPARLPPLSRHDRDRMLPSLSTLTGDVMLDHQPPPHPPHWTAFNSSMAYRQPHPPLHRADSPATMDFDGSSVASTATPERLLDGGSNSSLNHDDPDVQLAAEALSDLRADFISSPPDTGSLPPMSPRTLTAHPTPPLRQQTSPQSEPLLSLLTTSHHLVASTIGGASSAYGGAKNFSPRFKSGAEYVEGYLTPIANTVNSVGRATGVEGGVRWFLGAGRRAAPSDSEQSGSSKKRRKVGNDANATSQSAMDQARTSRNQSADADDSSPSDPRTPRRLSTTSTVDTLPAYDEMRSPAYTETAGPQNPPRSTPSVPPWQSRLIMSTSGLSVAMSSESLRSLKYCLRWLRWSNDHMGRVIGNLKTALEEYESAIPEGEQPEGAQAANEEGVANGESPERTEQSRAELANKINTLKGDVLKTLQDAINNVSKYAGGALPENARVLVRRHLTSLPQRFRVATMSSNAENGDNDSESAIREGAQKVLVLAKEGLDMVTQISGVVDGTIVSAEDWCERMGKKRRPSKEELAPAMLPPMESYGDVKMGCPPTESYGDVKMG